MAPTPSEPSKEEGGSGTSSDLEDEEEEEGLVLMGSRLRPGMPIYGHLRNILFLLIFQLVSLNELSYLALHQISPWT